MARTLARYRRQRPHELRSVKGLKVKGKRYTRADLKDHDLIMARRIVAAGLECTGLEETDLASLPKNDERKALIAHLLMERTSVPQKWIVEKLAMGSAPYVSRLAKEMGQRIAAGDRVMKRLKKATIARIITWYPFLPGGLR